MQIAFYTNFYKKNNSTKRPVAGGVLEEKTIDGYLKEPCSIMNPVINFQSIPVSNSPHVLSYAYIPIFDRYYFVKDWVWNDGLWTCYMDVDVLATYKIDIGLQEEYILRTDSTGYPADYNGKITDITYPTTVEYQTNVRVLPNVFSTVGAISYYAMTSSEFGALKSKLFSDDNLVIMDIIDGQGKALVTDLSQEVLKTMYNPYQYIVSCMWFPFGKVAITDKSPQTGIPIGWWSYPTLTGDLLYAQQIEIGDESLVVPTHPQSSRGVYLNYAPYTRVTLVGRFGTFPVDLSCFVQGQHIIITYVIDLITGQCYAKFSRKDESGSTTQIDLLAERQFLIGVPIQIAQVGTDYLGTAVNALNTIPQIVGGAISGIASGKGAIMGAIAGGASGIYNTLQSAMPQVETGGQNGSFLSPSNQTRAIIQFYKIVDEDIEHRGRPLCEIRQINTLHGYILCAEGDLDINAFDAERQEIARFLTEGFFWE